MSVFLWQRQGPGGPATDPGSLGHISLECLQGSRHEHLMECPFASKQLIAHLLIIVFFLPI